MLNQGSLHCTIDPRDAKKKDLKLKQSLNRNGNGIQRAMNNHMAEYPYFDYDHLGLMRNSPQLRWSHMLVVFLSSFRPPPPKGSNRKEVAHTQLKTVIKN